MSVPTVCAYMPEYYGFDARMQMPSPVSTGSISPAPTESDNSLDPFRGWSPPQSTGLADFDVVHSRSVDQRSWTLSPSTGYFTQPTDAMSPTFGNEKSAKIMKRQAQNRAAQRAFRERKQQSLRELEESNLSLQSQISDLKQENKRLRDLHEKSQAESKLLKLTSACRVESAVDECLGLDSMGITPNEIILRIDLHKLLSL